MLYIALPEGSHFYTVGKLEDICAGEEQFALDLRHSEKVTYT